MGKNTTIYHLQGVLQGPPPLQWVYSIPAFCRGQVKRRAPAVQTLPCPDELVATVCPKLFGTPKMYQNGLQMSNYCAQLPPHTRLYIHGRPQILKSPYGYTQGPKFIVFQNARIQTIFEDVKKTYFKFNQITMRPAYNGEELFFEQNK